MSATSIQKGDAINFIPTANVAAGDVVVQGDLIGVARLDIPAHTLGALALEGVFGVSKATGASTGIAVGSKIYWNATDKVATVDEQSGSPAVDNIYMGKSVRVAADDEGIVEVKLCP